MKWQKHEESIQNKLREYQYPVDTEAVWKQVSAHVPSRRRRRGAWILFFSGMIVGTVVLTYWAGSWQADGTEETIATKPHKAEITLQKNTGTANAFPQSTSVESGKQEESVPAHIDPTGKATTTSRQKQEKRIATSTSTPPSLSPSITIPEAEIFNGQTLHGAQSTLHTTDDEPGTLIFTDSSDADDGQKSIPDKRSAWTTPKVSALGLAPLNCDERAYSDAGLIEIRKPGKLAFGFLAGSGIAYHAFHGGRNDEKYLGELKRNTNALPDIHADVLVRYGISPRFSLQSGLSYARSSWRMEQEWTTSQRIQIPGEELHIDPSGNITSTPATVGATEITRHSASRYTYVHSISVPVQVHYRLAAFSRVRVAAQGGIALHLFTTSQGSYLTTENTLEMFQGNQDTGYRDAVISVAGGLSLEYVVRPNISLMLNPSYTHRNLKAEFNTIHYTQSISDISCRLGALIQF